jgi:hypothetical protein
MTDINDYVFGMREIAKAYGCDVASGYRMARKGKFQGVRQAKKGRGWFVERNLLPKPINPFPCVSTD